MIVAMLTTVDNPYDPFDQFKEWFNFDVSKGYHSIDLVGRVVRSSEEISEADQALAIEQGIDEIVEENLLGIYRKVTRQV